MMPFSPSRKITLDLRMSKLILLRVNATTCGTARLKFPFYLCYLKVSESLMIWIGAILAILEVKNYKVLTLKKYRGVFRHQIIRGVIFQLDGRELLKMLVSKALFRNLGINLREFS